MSTALDIDRTILTSMRFEMPLMAVPERRAFHVAEAMLRRIDRALAFHSPDLDGSCQECDHRYPCPTVVALGIDTR